MSSSSSEKQSNTKSVYSKNYFSDNDEDNLKKLGEVAENFEKKKTAEVGNIFTFGTGKCEQLGVYYTNDKGERLPVYLGSYGIGITRLIGVLVEVFGTDNSMIWPESVSPFQIHIVTIAKSNDEIAYKDSEAYKVSEDIYKKLKEAGADVLWDDRIGVSAGEKFADADLIGVPMRATISERSLAAGGVELHDRKSDTKEIVPISAFIKSYTESCR